MTTRIYIDRSRIIERERCPRRRWLTYHQDGGGIVPAKTPLPLAVGGAVHAGLATLLRASMEFDEAVRAMVLAGDAPQTMVGIEELAVKDALAEFQKYRTGLELDASETTAMQPTTAAQTFQQQVVAQARELGMDPAAIGQLGSDPAVARGEFDRYLWAEQSALVEGLVRAYARRRLRPLLEQFEVLEVEREGEWLLSRFASNYPSEDKELWFMSRPDALLRERQTNELYLLSYKTTATWDVRKARDIEHDMQGLSEGVEVERRLGEWWEDIQSQKDEDSNVSKSLLRSALIEEGASGAMRHYLHSLESPPRIHAIRYEFLLKGERWKDKELSARLGIEVRSQKSHLIRQYVATSVPKKGDGGYKLGDVCWSWDFYRPEDDRDSTLAWQNWKSRAVFGENEFHSRGGLIKEWIDALDRSELLMSGADSTVGLPPRVLGWKSPAQAMGVTKDHPLDLAFVPPVTVYRSDDQLRDWVESTEHAEREAAGHVAEVAGATDPGERRHLLNLYFPQHRHSCEYPSQCWATKVCFAGAEMQASPLAVGGGMFVKRTPNHPQELLSIDKVPK